jgi:non-specific serine/threonine protein kinase
VAGHVALPVALTSFIGHDETVVAADQAIVTARLLTLTGAGGGGKTRLALRVATAAAANYPDGVWWVELAAVADAALLPRVIATALGLREQRGRVLVATIAEALHGRRCLLVLDTCEHLVSACAVLADHLLRACPDLSILATSREALGITGETTWRVPALTLPDPRIVPAVEELMRSEAVQLFIERARAVQPGFTLTPQHAPTVAAVCRRLDGNPLALELAAARLTILSIEDIAARLDDCVHLLTTGSRTAPPRHRTLRATLDWSHALLTEPEQALLARLSVFAGGFTLDAAEAVGSNNGGPDVPLPPAYCLLPTHVLDLLARLADKSLVVAEVDTGEPGRYHLPETVRQYAAIRLAERGETDLVQRRHAAYYLSLVESAEAMTCASLPEGRGGLTGLEREHDNLRTALRWTDEQGEAAMSLRLGGILGSPGPMSRPAGGVTSQPHHLTRREREVAGLIAQGLTNRQIAARFSISERTIDTHVANILGKLGVTTRAQVAVWAVSQAAPGA